MTDLLPPPAPEYDPPRPLIRRSWWRRKAFKLPVWMWIALVALVVAFVSASNGPNENEPAVDTTDPPAPAAAEDPAPAAAADPAPADAAEPAPAAAESGTYTTGQTAETGGLRVTVHGVTDPYVPGNDIFTPDAGRRWIAADIELLNDGDEDTSFSSLIGVELQLADNTMASVTITGDSLPSLDGTVAAGGGLRGTVVFEAPEGTPWSNLRIKGNLTAAGAVFTPA